MYAKYVLYSFSLAITGMSETFQRQKTKDSSKEQNISSVSNSNKGCLSLYAYNTLSLWRGFAWSVLQSTQGIEGSLPELAGICKWGLATVKLQFPNKTRRAFELDAKVNMAFTSCALLRDLLVYTSPPWFEWVRFIFLSFYLHIVNKKITLTHLVLWLCPGQLCLSK